MTVKKKKGIAMLVAGVASLSALVGGMFYGNTALMLNTYTVTSENLPQSFDGYRIAHVSDLHNAQMGKNNEKLLTMLIDSKPDIIAITGDLVDSRNTDITVALQFAQQAVKIAPCYYVSGNHEARISEYSMLKEELIKTGVTVLEDSSLEIEHSDNKIIIAGVDDPSFKTDYLFGDSATVMQNKLEKIITNNDTYTVLLSHRPELFDVYADCGVDLALSGHAHGGQFRLPFIGGLLAPNQGLFPKYDSGQYTYKNTNMIVSRGIGNSLFPLRLFNRPEVILIELKSNYSADANTK